MFPTCFKGILTWTSSPTIFYFLSSSTDLAWSQGSLRTSKWRFSSAVWTLLCSKTSLLPSKSSPLPKVDIYKRLFRPASNVHDVVDVLGRMIKEVESYEKSPVLETIKVGTKNLLCLNLTSSGAPYFLERPNDHPFHGLHSCPRLHLPRSVFATSPACWSCPTFLPGMALDPPLQDHVGNQALQTHSVRQCAP